MPAIPINVHFHVGNSGVEHRGKILIGPNGMNPITGSGAGNECRWSVARNGRVAAAREWRRSRINDAYEVRSGRDSRQGIAGRGVLLVELVKKERRGGSQFGPGRETDDANLVRIDAPFFGVCAHQPNGLQRIIHRVRFRIVAVGPQPIPQNDRVDAVVEEVRDKVRPFSADIESVVSAARGEDDGRAGVEAAIDRMQFDRRIVDVDNAADPPGHRAIHVVLLRLAHAVVLQKRGASRVKWRDQSALQDWLGRIRRIIGRPRSGYSD